MSLESDLANKDPEVDIFTSSSNEVFRAIERMVSAPSDEVFQREIRRTEIENKIIDELENDGVARLELKGDELPGLFDTLISYCLQKTNSSGKVYPAFTDVSIKNGVMSVQALIQVRKVGLNMAVAFGYDLVNTNEDGRLYCPKGGLRLNIHLPSIFSLAIGAMERRAHADDAISNILTDPTETARQALSKQLRVPLSQAQFTIGKDTLSVFLEKDTNFQELDL